MNERKSELGELKTFEDEGFDEASAAAVSRFWTQQQISLPTRPAKQSGR